MTARVLPYLGVLHADKKVRIRCRGKIPSTFLVVEQFILLFLKSDCPCGILFLPASLVKIQEACDANLCGYHLKINEVSYLGSRKRNHLPARVVQGPHGDFALIHP